MATHARVAPSSKHPALSSDRDLLSPSLESEMFRKSICTYQYQSPALSLLERMYLEAFWKFLAKRVYPPWLAPNLLTLAGGLCDVAALALTLTHSSALLGTSPRWVYFACACLLLTYQTLDGSDGYQARRTHSGSALGELMDHGIDAWVVPSLVIYSIDAFSFGWRAPEVWLFVLGSQWAFALTNMTLLVSGRMAIGLIDVMEVQTAMAASLLLTAIAGPALWDTPLSLPLLPPLSLRSLVFLCSSGGIAISVARNALIVAQTVSHQVPAVQLGQLISLLCSYTVVTSLCVYRASELPGAEGDLALALLLLCSMFSFAEAMARMLVLRLGRLRLPVVPRSVVCMCLFRAALEIGPAARLAVVLLSAALHLSFFVQATRALARVLGVHPFRVRGASHWYKLH
mmetsp:Transcript_39508/g.89632  ORF Transcript_39508/g.89632 Transcript_39508/m.89632 type:complete len:401 (-) Transcript_39508:549-1751(-)